MSKKQILTMAAFVFALVISLTLALNMLTDPASAASSSEIQNQIDQLEKEQEALKEQMAQLESSLAQNKKDIKSLIARKNGIDQQVSLLHTQISTVRQTISVYNLMIADKQDELDVAQKRLTLLHAAYKDRIRAMEEQGKISYWAVIFEANSFFDMLDRLKMVEDIERADRQRLDELRKAADRVESARAELQEQKKSLEKQRRELEKAEADLEIKRGEASGLLLELLVKGDEYIFEMDESERLQHELMDQIAGLEEDKIWAEYLEWLATSVPPTTTTTAPPTTRPKPTTRPTTIPTTVPTTLPTTFPTSRPTIPSVVPTTPTIPTPPPTTIPTKPTTAPTQPTNQAGKGREVDGYIWYTPTKNYVITSEFGPRVHPITGKPNTFHYGIDMAAAEGTPIYATRAGVVRVATYQEGGAGYHVSLGHDGGYISIYMHMTHFVVKRGDYVQAGQLIGYVGSTGGSTGPHLHFGIAKNGTYMDPRLFIYV